MSLGFKYMTWRPYLTEETKFVRTSPRCRGMDAMIRRFVGSTRDEMNHSTPQGSCKTFVFLFESQSGNFKPLWALQETF